MGLEESVGANGVRREEHNGAWAGYRADILRLPDERLTVACLCNLADAHPSAQADAVAVALVPKLAGAAAPSAPAQDDAPESTVAPADLAPALGAYYDPMTFEIRKSRSRTAQSSLDFQLAPGGYRRKLAARDARSFVVLGVPAASATTYRFEPATGSSPRASCAHRRSARRRRSSASSPRHRRPPRSRSTRGRYTSDEVLRDMDIEVVDGKLVLGEWGRTLGPDPMKPLTADVFTFGGVGFRFARDKRGKVERLHDERRPARRHSLDEAGDGAGQGGREALRDAVDGAHPRRGRTRVTWRPPPVYAPRARSRARAPSRARP